MTKTSYYMELFLDSTVSFTFIKILFVSAVLAAILGVRLVEVYFDI